MPDLKPYVILGLALGGLFAVSSVGIVVLYRTTAVLNLAGGAVGALGALVAWSLTGNAGAPRGIGYLAAVLVAAGLTLAYGLMFGPALAGREALVKMMGTLPTADQLAAAAGLAGARRGHA